MNIKNELDFSRYFTNEAIAKDFISNALYPNGVPCPYCKCPKCYSIERGERFKCSNSDCYKKFRLLTGTFFHSTNLSYLEILFIIMKFIEKSESTYTIAQKTGISQLRIWSHISRLSKYIINIPKSNEFEDTVRYILATKHSCIKTTKYQ